MQLQRTFELIPTTLVPKTSHKPPMTSKQVKKAYQKANKEKRVSHAEQRRLYAEELARQRREYKRQKAAEKARAIREKKTAKLLAQAESRKKAGLLEPRRLPRASQKSIAIFVRDTYHRNKSGERIMISMKSEEDKNSTIKKTYGNNESNDNENENENQVDNNDEQMDVQSQRELNHSPVKKVALLMDSDDEYGDFPSCTQLEIMTSNASFDKVNQVFPPQETKIVSQAMCLQADLPSEELDGRKSQRLACSPDKHKAGGGFRLDCKASPSEPRPPSYALTSQILTQNHNEISQTDIFSATEENTPTKMLRIPQSIFSNSLKALEGSQSKKSMQKNNLSILSQKILAKEKDQLSSTHQRCHETHFQGKSHHDSPIRPAQDICDLISDLDADDFLSNSQILNEINPNGSVSTPDSIKAGLCSSKSEFPTPVSHSNLTIDFKPNFNFDIAAESSSYKTLSWNMGHGQNENFDDLICTQDLINMSQEIREMTSPSHASEPKFNVQKPKEKTRERKRFFEEKEEDLLEAALYESKMMNIVSTKIRQNDELVPIKNVSRLSSLLIAQPLSDKTDEKFSSERSKKLLTQKQKPLSTAARQYYHPSVSHGGSSPSISSFSWGIEESHLDSSPSTATDYGMDDLSGDDWAELSALC